MKVLHICLAGTVTDGWSYQENMLIKFHRQIGYDVTLITSRWMYKSNGELFKKQESVYYLDNGAKIIRLEIINKDNLTYKFKRYDGVYRAISAENPDIIFVHGCQFLDLKIVKQYVSKNKVRLFIDNHADFSNSATNFVSLFVLHKFIWRHLVKQIEPYVEKFYGVLPARVTFLEQIYKTPKEKTELLVMGGDDELIDIAEKEVAENRLKLNCSPTDFLIVTGGKIDSSKKQVIQLMRIIKELGLPHVKMVVFGSVEKDIEAEFFPNIDGKTINYLGWIDTESSYKVFRSADLVVFPGRHSVYWEQAASQGRPLIVKDWPGTHHLDFGGNVLFWKNDDYIWLSKTIKEIVSNKDSYTEMLNKANSCKSNFYYSNIARKSIK